MRTGKWVYFPRKMWELFIQQPSLGWESEVQHFEIPHRLSGEVTQAYYQRFSETENQRWLALAVRHESLRGCQAIAMNPHLETASIEVLLQRFGQTPSAFELLLSLLEHPNTPVEELERISRFLRENKCGDSTRGLIQNPALHYEGVLECIEYGDYWVQVQASMHPLLSEEEWKPLILTLINAQKWESAYFFANCKQLERITFVMEQLSGLRNALWRTDSAVFKLLEQPLVPSSQIWEYVKPQADIMNGYLWRSMLSAQDCPRGAFDYVLQNCQLDNPRFEALMALEYPSCPEEYLLQAGDYILQNGKYQSKLVYQLTTTLFKNPKLPIPLMRKLTKQFFSYEVADDDFYKWRSAAQALAVHPACEESHLIRLTELDGVRELICTRASLSEAVLARLMQSDDVVVKRRLPAHSQLTAEQLEAIFEPSNKRQWESYVKNPNTPASVLKQLALNRGVDLRCALLAHPNVPSEVVVRYKKTKNRVLHLALIRYGHYTEKELEHLCVNPDLEIARFALRYLFKSHWKCVEARESDK